MQNLNKKGLSQIVTMVIFIVMVMASIALIGGAVLKLTDKTDLAPFTNCLNLQRNPSTIQTVDFKEGFLEVNVKRSIDEIYSLDFILETPRGSERYSCSQSCGGHCNLQGPNQEKTFYFPTQEGEVTEVKLLANGNCELHERKL
jgi:hypothetical protein